MPEENDLVWDFVLPLASSGWNVLFKIRCFFFLLILACLFRIPSKSLLLNQLGPPQLLPFSLAPSGSPKVLIVVGHPPHQWGGSFSAVATAHGSLPGGHFFCFHRQTVLVQSLTCDVPALFEKFKLVFLFLIHS